MPSSLRKKTQFHVFIALILALITAFLINTWMQQQEAKINKEVAPLVVTRVEIPENMELTAGMLKTIPDYPADLIPIGAVQNVDEVIGKYTRAKLAAEQVLVHSLVGNREEISALSFQLKPGRRAMTIRIDDERGVGNNLREGDRVDIICVLEDESGEKYSATVLQDILILKLNGTGIAGEQRTRGATATLDLSQKEAAMIAFLEDEYGIRLTLRPNDDREKLNPEIISLDDIPMRFRPKLPVVSEKTEPKKEPETKPEPEPTPKIDYIRGNKIVKVEP